MERWKARFLSYLISILVSSVLLTYSVYWFLDSGITNMIIGTILIFFGGFFQIITHIQIALEVRADGLNDLSGYVLVFTKGEEEPKLYEIEELERIYKERLEEENETYFGES